MIPNWCWTGVTVGSAVAANNNAQFAGTVTRIAVSEGDQFVITGKGGTTGSRLYSWLDADKNVLANAASGASLTNATITAPSGAAYLVAGAYSDSAYTLYKI